MFSPNPIVDTEFNSFLYSSKSSEIGNVQRDLQIIDGIQKRVNEAVEVYDHTRMIGLVSVSQSDIPKLRETLLRLLSQLDSQDTKADIFIGLNEDADADVLQSMLDTYRLRQTDLFTLETSQDQFENDQLFDNPSLEGVPYAIENARTDMHRLFFVHQYSSSNSKGKNRMLRILNNAVIQGISSGQWSRPPATTLEFDADSRFYDGMTMDSNGLEILHREKEQRDLEAIGTRWRTVVFEDGEPNLEAPVSNPYKFIDYSQYHWFRFMVGGGTLGNTDVMTATRWPVSNRYPGSLSDDVHRTMYMSASDRRWGVSDYAFVTNECRNSREQVLRWLKGTFGLRHDLGRKNMSKMYRSPHPPSELITMRNAPDTGDLLEEAIRNPLSIYGEAHWTT